MRAGGLWACAMSASACVPAGNLSLPEVAGAKSLLVVAFGGHEDRPIRERVAVEAFDLTAGGVALQLALDPRATTAVLYYQQKLEELQISPGSVPLVDAGRPFPPWSTALSGTVENIWGPLAEQQAQMISELRIADYSVVACALAGGCFSADTGLACLQPCPQPAAPTRPELPRNLPQLEALCPNGQEALLLPSTRTPFCEPAATCPPDQVAFPPDFTCQLIERSCPPGQYAQDLPPSDVIYVEHGAPPGGAGTRASPMGSIRDAIASAAPGAVIALSAGTFIDDVETIPGDLTIWGKCSADTRVQFTSTAAIGLDVLGPNVILRRLSIGGGLNGVRAGGAGRSVYLEDVVVDGPGGAGVSVVDGSLVAERLVLRREDSTGVAIRGGAAMLRRVFVDGASGCGLRARGGATVEVDHLAVRRAIGGAVCAGEGASITASRVLIEQTTGAGVYIEDADTTAQFSELLVRDTTPANTATFDGSAIRVDRARARFSDVIAARSQLRSIHLLGTSSVTIARLVSRDPAPFGPDGSVGLALTGGSRASVARAIFENSIHAAVDVQAMSVAELIGLRVRGILRDIDRIAIRAADSTLIVRETVVEDTMGIAVGAHTSVVSLFDVAARRNIDGVFMSNSNLTMERIEVTGAERTCIAGRNTLTTVNATDLSITTCGYGGLEVERGALASIERAEIRDAGPWGLRLEVEAFVQAGSIPYSFQDLRVIGAKERMACGAECEPAGVRVNAGVHVSFTRFEIAESDAVGMLISPGATVTAVDGEIHHQPIGLRIPMGADLLKVLNRVRVHDNQTNVEL